MIMIQVHMYVHPSEREDFLEQIGILQRKTREESGNVCSLLYEAVEEKNTFVVIEKWKDQEALNQHNNTDHFVGFFQIANEYWVRPVKAEVHEVPDAGVDDEDAEAADGAVTDTEDKDDANGLDQEVNADLLSAAEAAKSAKANDADPSAAQ